MQRNKLREVRLVKNESTQVMSSIKGRRKKLGGQNESKAAGIQICRHKNIDCKKKLP